VVELLDVVVEVALVVSMDVVVGMLANVLVVVSETADVEGVVDDVDVRVSDVDWLSVVVVSGALVVGVVTCTPTVVAGGIVICTLAVVVGGTVVRLVRRRRNCRDVRSHDHSPEASSERD
jgi:hypothetical protein